MGLLEERGCEYDLEPGASNGQEALQKALIAAVASPDEARKFAQWS